MLKIVIALVLLAAVAVPSILFATQHQQGTEARVNAFKHDDGRIEFAIQVWDGEDWGERILPDTRTLSATAPTDRWLSSSAVTITPTPHVYSPITSPFFRSRQKERIHTPGDVAFQATVVGTDTFEYLQTVVWLMGKTNYANLVGQVTVKCTGGYTSWDNYDDEGNAYSAWVPGELSGWLRLMTSGGFGSVTQRDYDSDSPIQVTVNQPRLLGDHAGPIQGIPESLEWTFDYGQWIDEEMLNVMQDYDYLTVQVVDLHGRLVTSEFSLRRLFATPVQGNLSHCGDY